jgi:hypothetical protein
VKAKDAEDTAQTVILAVVAGMAGAGSFTHVHDWTMRNVPPGTGSWLGWANAVITELVPAAAGIEIRRRKRQNPPQPVVYPMTILIADAIISIVVQLADALHTLAGGLAFALPALAFLALTKLLLSRTRTIPEMESPECAAQPASVNDAPTHAPASAHLMNGVSAIATGITSQTAPRSADISSSADALALTASPSKGSLQPLPTGQLLISARMTAFAHRQATGQPITATELGDRLSVPPALAESLLDHIDGTPPPVTEPNGTVMNGSRP